MGECAIIKYKKRILYLREETIKKSEKEMQDYIDNLRKVYDIKVKYLEVNKLRNMNLFFKDNLFKIIKVPKKKAIDKEKIAFLYI